MEELLADLAESRADIVACERALHVGYTHHRNGLSVQARLDRNREIIATIEDEIAARGSDVMEAGR